MRNGNRILRRVIPWVMLAVMVFATLGCRRSEPCYFSGRTMGTVYHITVIAEDAGAVSDLSYKITERLDSINKSMSLFRGDSELSRFNHGEEDVKFCVSDPFMKVFRTGANLYSLTGGAWDGTVAPLVSLWGFGPEPETPGLPAPRAIEKALARVGYNRIRIVDDRCLVKEKKGLSLDFGSIAKGFAVDEIAELLMENNMTDYLVEIGGEVRAGGSNLGRVWKVGINTPRPDAPVDQLITAVELENRAIATSGDYRNFRTRQDKTYAHEIDPRTGWPVENDVASVSVMADTAMFADGLATALMVMGETKGLALVNSLDRVDCLFIVRDKGCGFKLLPSRNFKGMAQAP